MKAHTRAPRFVYFLFFANIGSSEVGHATSRIPQPRALLSWFEDSRRGLSLHVSPHLDDISNLKVISLFTLFRLPFPAPIVFRGPLYLSSTTSLSSNTAGRAWKAGGDWTKGLSPFRVVP